MKLLWTFLFVLLVCSIAVGQNSIKIVTTEAQSMTRTGELISIWSLQYEPVVTDSVVWRVVEVDSLHLGEEDCEHEWVYSDTWRPRGMMSCLVMHYGFHCSWNDLMRNRICKECHRKETQREFWYQHRKEHVKTEYEELDKKLQKQGQKQIFDIDDSIELIYDGDPTLIWVQ